MSDIIRLLPDSIANQIAAGEVIQRPASVVKELLENSIDAHSTRIEVTVKDAGKTLISVFDNGIGMTDTDARMSLERHATSKISSADDLFRIKTKGFRGEALPSIASISNMKLNSRNSSSEIGTQIKISGGKLESQEPFSAVQGTQIVVRDLFFNVPARRKFLKSDRVELNHIIDEFERVALAHPDVHFLLSSDGNELFHLPKANLRQRIVAVFGKKYNELLLPLNSETQIAAFSGFVIKPEGARKRRGDQFFFVNNRFIKSPTLHHWVAAAFDELLAPELIPGYFIHIDIDPGKIDINIHPTKTEIKFEDERAIGLLLQSAVKQSLGMHSVRPELDFERESSFELPPDIKNSPPKAPSIKVDPMFNPFNQNKPGKSALSATREFYTENQSQLHYETQKAAVSNKIIQIKRKYILAPTESGVLVVHQYRAHYTIQYDLILDRIKRKKPQTQLLAFPETVSIGAREVGNIKILMNMFRELGFDIELFGKDKFVIRGIPDIALNKNATELISDLLSAVDLKEKNPNEEALSLELAKRTCIQSGQKLNAAEMESLINDLFARSNPERTPDGRLTFVVLKSEELDQRFNH